MHVNQNDDSVYNTVYGNSDSSSEEDLRESVQREDENAQVVNVTDFDKELHGVFDRYKT